MQKRHTICNPITLFVIAVIAICAAPLHYSKNLYAQTQIIAQGEMQNFILHQTPKSIETIRFTDQNNTPLTLETWNGKYVLLNLWASWCAPCRKEMPDFDALQTQFKTDHFEILTVSLDKDIKKAQIFFRDIEIKNLPLYIDPETPAITQALRARGLPVTLLINPQGEEIGRLTGPANWHSKDAQNFVRSIVKNIPES